MRQLSLLRQVYGRHAFQELLCHASNTFQNSCTPTSMATQYGALSTVLTILVERVQRATKLVKSIRQTVL